MAAGDGAAAAGEVWPRSAGGGQPAKPLARIAATASAAAPPAWAPTCACAGSRSDRAAWLHCPRHEATGQQGRG